MLLSIIIVTYNSIQDLPDCLDSIQEELLSLAQISKNTETLAENYEIIIVDNASDDHTLEFLQTQKIPVKVISNSENRGYARAVNQGLKVSIGDYIFILNPDIKLLPGATLKLIKFLAEHGEAGLVGPKLVNPDGSLQYSCRTFYTFASLILRRTFFGDLFPNHPTVQQHLMKDWDHNSVKAVDWLLGGALMLKREILQKIGLMEERFFLYFEDVDWCFRMKQANLKVYYNPEAQAVHQHRRHSSKLFSKAWWQHFVSMLRFYEKWSGNLSGGDLFSWFRKVRHGLALITLIFSDLIGLNLSFWIAYSLRAYMAFPGKPLYSISEYFPFLLFANFILLSVFGFGGLYRLPRPHHAVDEFFEILKAKVYVLLILMAASFLSKQVIYSRFVITLSVLFATSSIFAFRASIKSLLRLLYKAGFGHSRVLLVGKGRVAEVIEATLRSQPELGLQVTKITDNPEAILSNPDSAQFEEIIFTSLSPKHEPLLHKLTQSYHRFSNIKVVSEATEMLSGIATFEEFLGIPMICYGREFIKGGRVRLQRFIDLLISSLGLIIFSPLFALIAVAIKLDSRGPILFRQQRIGLNNKPFTMLKFRSMIAKAEALKQDLLPRNEAAGPLFKIRQDPRITRTGRFLRRYSIDELPQLINVFNGQMSLVGPRPPLPEEVKQYSEWHGRRLEVRPGMTGLPQVSGRSDLDFNEIVRLDIYYIQNYSITLNLKILFKTIPTILFRKGAY